MRKCFHKSPLDTQCGLAVQLAEVLEGREALRRTGAIRFLFFCSACRWARRLSLSRSLTHVPRSRCERAGSATPRGRSSSVSLRRSAAGESPELEHFFVFRLFASAFFELN